MGLDLPQRREVNLQQHRNNQHPDENAHWEVDLGHLDGADGMERSWRSLAQDDADHDAQCDLIS